jgi:hypothetical protein
MPALLVTRKNIYNAIDWLEKNDFVPEIKAEPIIFYYGYRIEDDFGCEKIDE